MNIAISSGLREQLIAALVEAEAKQIEEDSTFEWICEVLKQGWVGHDDETDERLIEEFRYSFYSDEDEEPGDKIRELNEKLSHELNTIV